MKKYLIIIISTLLIGCKSYDNPYIFSGDTFQYNSYKKSSFRSQDTILNIDFSKCDISNYTEPKLLNKSDIFCFSKRIEKADNSISYSLILANFKAEIIDTLYSSKPNEIIDTYCFSPNDSLVIVRTFAHNDFLNDSSEYRIYKNYPMTYKIINVATKKSTLIYQSKSSIYSEKFNNSIWTTDSKNIIVSELKKEKKTNERIQILYQLNILTKDTTFIDSGRCPSVSSDNKILYKKGKNILVLNLNTMSRKIIYTKKGNKNIGDIKWIPNSSHIFIPLTKHTIYDDITVGHIGFRSTTKRIGIVIDSEGNIINNNFNDAFCYTDWR
jgi:hypothetical protein